MIDPLNAISLASAIVSFVDFGSKLLGDGYAAYKSQKGASEEDVDIEETTVTLQELAGRLSSLQGASRTKDEDALAKLASSCVSLAEELLKTWEELKVTVDGPLRTLDAGRKTIRKYLKADKISKMQKRLDRIQKDMNTHLLAVLRNEQSSVTRSLRDNAETSERMHFTALGRINLKSG